MYFNMEKYHSNVQPCRKNLYLIIICIFVALLFFHLIVDFVYCCYYCICIYMYLLYASEEVLILRINCFVVVVEAHIFILET